MKAKSFKRKIYYIIGVVLSAIFVFSVLSPEKVENTWNSVFAQVGLSENRSNDNETEKEIEAKMSVHFLDVGNADCSYIKCGDVNILIDAADKEPQGEVVRYLQNNGVKRLDLVVVSHPHRDHIGQMREVIENFEVSKFIEPDLPDEIVPTTFTYKKMLESLARKNISAQLVSAGNKFTIGDLELEILAPVCNHNDNLNNNSIVARVRYGDVYFLFTGDAEKAEEKDILGKNFSVQSDVLKVGHHGSGTSTTTKFLAAVSPKYAVISAARGRYKVGKSKILEHLKKFCGDNVFVTGDSGTVIITTDGKDISAKGVRSRNE